MLKPFDLKAAMNGEKVMTRDGREVAELHPYLRAEPACVVFTVSGDAGLRRANMDGRLYADRDSPADLLMSPRTIWINLTAPALSPNFGEGHWYESESAARKDVLEVPPGTYIAIAIPVEI